MQEPKQNGQGPQQLTRKSINAAVQLKQQKQITALVTGATASVLVRYVDMSRPVQTIQVEQRPAKRKQSVKPVVLNTAN